jgi:hypothetical protein
MGSHRRSLKNVKANQPMTFRMEGDTKVFDMQARPFK